MFPTTPPAYSQLHDSYRTPTKLPQTDSAGPILDSTNMTNQIGLDEPLAEAHNSQDNNSTGTQPSVHHFPVATSHAQANHNDGNSTQTQSQDPLTGQERPNFQMGLKTKPQEYTKKQMAEPISDTPDSAPPRPPTFSRPRPVLNPQAASYSPELTQAPADSAPTVRTPIGKTAASKKANKGINKGKNKKGKHQSEADAAVSEAPSPQRVSPRKKQPKIMLPAPLPTQEYCELARAEPSVSESGERMLVVLDLNGTLLYRPNPRRKPSEHKPRPFLGEFMEYLFRNFHVMVWSSSRPENVAKMVEKNLDGVQKARLIACWGREQFGLSAKHYDQNVQCYKNLQRVWSNEDIQKKHSDYQDGKRFDQRNTILIDDSALKANAQPHNLILIPEFTATDEQINGADILKEVAGYLQKVKVQSDVSSYMHKNPFKADEHTYEWPELRRLLEEMDVSEHVC